MKIKQGYIYLIKINPLNSGIKRTRPCLVIQNNSYNNKSDTTIIIPLSSKSEYKIRPKGLIVLKNDFLMEESIVLTHLVTSVLNNRIIKELGKINRLDNVMILDTLNSLIN